MQALHTLGRGTVNEDVTSLDTRTARHDHKVTNKVTVRAEAPRPTTATTLNRGPFGRGRMQG